MKVNRKELFDRVLKLRFGKVAMLIIDMQKGFLAPGATMEVPQGRNIISRIAHLADACRKVDVPVIYTRFVYSPGVPTLLGELHVEHKPLQPGISPGFGRPSSCCLEGDESAAIIPELKSGPGELVIDKRGYDAFHETPLDSALRGRGVENLVITGVMTDICVLATVSGAMHRGYRVTVVRDGVATLWPQVQEVTLDLMERAYARVIPAGEVAAEIKNIYSRG